MLHWFNFGAFLEEFSLNCCVFSVYRVSQNHKGPQQQQPPQHRYMNDYNPQMSHVRPEPHQSFQQRSTNQLQAINEILSKSKSALNNLQKNQEQMKVFPEDAPQKPASASNSSSDKKSLKLQIDRLNSEQIEQMTRSVSSFAKNSPESAKKLGVIKDEVDLFSLMKADERTLKRKTDNDVCACKYFKSHIRVIEHVIKMVFLSFHSFST